MDEIFGLIGLYIISVEGVNIGRHIAGRLSATPAAVTLGYRLGELGAGDHQQRRLIGPDHGVR